MNNMQIVGIIVPKALLTFAHCTASSNSSYHPQFPSWSLLPGLGRHNSFRDHTINQVRKEGYLEKEKDFLLGYYFARILFRHFVSLFSPTVMAPEQSHQ